MPALVLGPLLRHIGPSDATIWVETDEPCTVSALGHEARTFHVAGHHYALVTIEGLEPGGAYEYEVSLDGERVWPQGVASLPPSVVRTVDPGRTVKLLFGSCRVSVPHGPPYTASPDEHPHGRGPDALYAFALRMMKEPRERWPAAILLLGDQVYADEVSPRTLGFIRSRRDTSHEPGEEVADFEEYTRLYWESWQEPVVRWFLATVSSAMLFDDHDVHDDWNISRFWTERMRAKPWWDDRIAGAFASYWIYQHLGNLSPRELSEDELFARVREAEDAAPILRRFALQSDRETGGARWSFCRDFGGTRLVALDCRAGRVLDRGRRSMVDADEWRWIVDHARGGHDHLLLGMSDPYLLAPGIHYLQAWAEAVCDGAWGKGAARLAEWMREAIDLDHWASFRRSFERLTDLVLAVGAGNAASRRPRSSRSPATCTTLTWQTWRSGAAPRLRAASTRRSARRSATRSVRANASPSSSPSRGSGTRSGALSHSPPASRLRGSAGDTQPARSSRTRSARSSSPGGAPTYGSRQPSPGLKGGPASRRSSSAGSCRTRALSRSQR